MDTKKTRQISIVLPILLAISFIMLMLYMMFGMFDRKLNETYNDNAYSAPSAPNSMGQDADTQYTERHDVSCYVQVLREYLAKYGEPRAVRISDAPGPLKSVFNPDLYYLDGVYIGLIDMDGDNIQELYCAAIDHEQVRVNAQLFGYENGRVVLLKESLPVMLLPEDSEQTILANKSAGNGCFLINDRFNPDGKPVELMDFYEKNGTEFTLAGKYARGKMSDTTAFEDYIRIENITTTPLSVEIDKNTGEAKTVEIFPQTGAAEDQILHYVHASADVISRILMVNE